MNNYKAIVTLTNGCHKVVRVSYRQMAHIVSEVRKFKSSVFNDVVKVVVNGLVLCLNEIISWKFIDEVTREELLTI